jgi:hypothetical protein
MPIPRLVWLSSPLAGQFFASQEEMLRNLANEKPGTDANNTRKQ